MTKCNRCHKIIFFDQRFKTMRGKLKPLDKIGDVYRAHDCKNSPYRKYNQRQRDRFMQFSALWMAK